MEADGNRRDNIKNYEQLKKIKITFQNPKPNIELKNFISIY